MLYFTQWLNKLNQNVCWVTPTYGFYTLLNQKKTHFCTEYANQNRFWWVFWGFPTNFHAQQTFLYMAIMWKIIWHKWYFRTIWTKASLSQFAPPACRTFPTIKYFTSLLRATCNQINWNMISKSIRLWRLISDKVLQWVIPSLCWTKTYIVISHIFKTANLAILLPSSII